MAVGQVCGQAGDTALDANIRSWANYTNHRGPRLMLTFDKSRYMPGENLLFTAYLMDGGRDTSSKQALHVILIDLAGRQVVASDRFLMNNGFGAGSLGIPDTLETGTYLIMAYTHFMRQGPVNLFYRKEIRVRAKEEAPFNLNIQSAVVKDDSVRMMVKAGTSYKGLASGADWAYSIMGDGHLLQKGKKKIDAFGEAEVVLLARDTLSGSLMMYSVITRGEYTARIKTPVRLTPDRVGVLYYPESGRLVDGQPTRVGVELRKPDGRGKAMRGEVLEDGEEVAAFETDKYGFGFFDYVPRAGKKMDVRFTGLVGKEYTVGAFPAVEAEGFSLQVSQGVLHDSLRLCVRGPADGKQYALLVYSRGEMLYAAGITLHGSSGTLVLPVADWPAGIAKVALLTMDERLLAERAVFVDHLPVVATLASDSIAYHRRSKVKVHIRIVDAQGKGVKGLFSIAASPSTRMNLQDFPERSTSVLFDQYLSPGHEAMPPSGYFTSDTSIEQILLARCRLQQSWRDMEDTVSRKAADFEDYGVVEDNEAYRIKRPIPLVLVGSSVYSFATDSSGQWRIPFEALIAPAGVNPLLSIAGKGRENMYHIDIRNVYDTLNSELAQGWYDQLPILEDTVMPEIPVDESFGIKTLKAAVVHSAGDGLPYGRGKSCRDWVCQYNVLNCPNHPTGVPPVKGEQYTYVDRREGPFAQAKLIIYTRCLTCGGCKLPSIAGTVPAVHLAAEPYREDLIKFSPTEPALYATLYWTPTVMTNAEGEAEVGFYTNDLVGKITVVVQGITGQGLFGGSKVIEVRP